MKIEIGIKNPPQFKNAIPWLIDEKFFYLVKKLYETIFDLIKHSVISPSMFLLRVNNISYLFISRQMNKIMSN